MNNVLDIYLNQDGSVLQFTPDFKISRGSYRNILINIYVPKSLLIDIVVDENGVYQTFNNVRIGAVIQTASGKNLQTKRHELQWVKDLIENGIEYSMFQRRMPKEFTAWETVNTLEATKGGYLNLIVNVTNSTLQGEGFMAEECSASPVFPLRVYPSAYLDMEEVNDLTDFEVLQGAFNNANKDVANIKEVFVAPNNDEEGNTYIYSKNKLKRIAIFNTNDNGEVAHIQIRDNLEQDFRTIQRVDKDLFVISNRNGDDIFNAQNGSLELYNNILDENGEFVDQQSIFRADEDGAFHRGNILLKHKDIKSLEDKVDENTANRHNHENKPVLDRFDGVEDNFASTSGTKALSANKGRELKNLIDSKETAKTYPTIKDMIDYLNSLETPISDFRVGYNLLIVETQVPDFWITEIAAEKVDYEYIDDTVFVARIKNEPIQIGWYKLSLLETQKVDLTDYVTGLTINGKNASKTGNNIQIEVDSEATENSENLISSGAVKKAVDNVNKKLEDTRVSTTYNELVALRNSSKLIKGAQYRITDYDCTTTQENTRSAGHRFDIIATADDVNVLNENARAIRNAEDTYFADSRLEAWELKYSLDNDKVRFAWADEENGKGVIYYMKDEFNNECAYDFKNIQFARYKRKWYSGEEAGLTSLNEDWTDTVGYKILDSFPSSTYTPIGKSIEDIVREFIDCCGYQEIFRTSEYDTSAPFDWQLLTSNETKYYYTFRARYIDNRGYNPIVTVRLGTQATDQVKWFYTFSSRDGKDIADDMIIYDGSVLNNNLDNQYTVHDNIIKEYYTNSDNEYVRLNNIVFLDDYADSCYANIFEANCYDMSFGSDCYGNIFGNDNNSNTFGTGCYGNTFGNEFCNNTLGIDCYLNIFGNGCYGNTFGTAGYHNSIANCCNNLMAGADFENNFFFNECIFINAGNSCSYNFFGNGCREILLGNNCYANSFFSGVYNIEIADDTELQEISNLGAKSTNELKDGESIILVRDGDRIALKYGHIKDNDYLAKIEMVDNDSEVGRIHMVTRDSEGNKVNELALGSRNFPNAAYLQSYDKQGNATKFCLEGDKKQVLIRFDAVDGDIENESYSYGPKYLFGEAYYVIGDKLVVLDMDGEMPYNYNIYHRLIDVEFTQGLTFVDFDWIASSIQTAFVPISVTTIRSTPCNIIYYKGTKSDWEKVTKTTTSSARVFCIDGETTYN